MKKRRGSREKKKKKLLEEKRREIKGRGRRVKRGSYGSLPHNRNLGKKNKKNGKRSWYFLELLVAIGKGEGNKKKRNEGGMGLSPSALAVDPG